MGSPHGMLVGQPTWRKGEIDSERDVVFLDFPNPAYPPLAELSELDVLIEIKDPAIFYFSHVMIAAHPNELEGT